MKNKKKVEKLCPRAQKLNIEAHFLALRNVHTPHAVPFILANKYARPIPPPLPPPACPPTHQ